MSTRPEKHPDVMALVKACVEIGNYLDTRRGRTLDKLELRIAVSFDESTRMLIITAIDLVKKGK